MPVHLYGQSADMDPLMAIARQHRLEGDRGCRAGHRHGIQATACVPARSATLAAFRSFPARIWAHSATPDCAPPMMPSLPKRMRVLRVHGGKPKYFHALIGGNFRIDELQAAVLRVKLKYLDGWTDGRQRNAAYYDAPLPDAGLGANLRTPLAVGGLSAYFQSIRRAGAGSRRAQGKAHRARHRQRDLLSRCRCICSSASPILSYRAGDFPAIRASRRRRLWRCRSIRNWSRRNWRTSSRPSPSSTPAARSRELSGSALFEIVGQQLVARQQLVEVGAIAFGQARRLADIAARDLQDLRQIIAREFIARLVE